MSESREKSERVVDQTCPDCGGLHFGSVGCSYNRAEPCTNCKQAIAYKQSRAFDQLGRPYHVNCQFLELKVPSATIDDALRLLRKMEGCSRDTAKLICLRNFAKSEREAGRRDALEEQWISVEEKLPELDRDVLVFCPDDTAGIFVDRRKKYRDERGRDDGDGWDAGDGSGVTVTHWQKLPEPPKAAAIRALK